MTVSRLRDLLIWDAPGRVVMAVDSIGGVGPLPGDAVAASAETVAHFALRVPLLEVLCAGATPAIVADALTIAREGAGEAMMTHLRALAAEAGVPPEGVTGSTEENLPTRETGIGITVLGFLPPDAPNRRARPGDVVLCAGLPLSAPRDELYPGHPGMVSVAEVRAALESGLTHDALPVGSRGVGFEVGELACTAGLAASLADGPVSLSDSGGPSSCVLFACREGDAPALASLFSAPVATVARLT